MLGDLDASPPRHTVEYTRVASNVGEGEGEGSSLVYTVDEAIETVGVGRFQFTLLAFAGLLWTAEAMEMLLLSFIKAPIQCKWGVSDASAAFVTTSVGIGFLTGASTWGFVADAYGRRFVFIATCAVTFVFGVISALSVNFAMLVIVRGVVGFGIGGAHVAFSMLMEFLPAAHRGTWGLGLALFWSAGAIFESVVAFLVVPSLGWRWLVAISSAPIGVVLVPTFWLVESPRWLISKGEFEKAQRSLEKVSRLNCKPLPPGRLASSSAISESGTHGGSARGELAEVLRPGARWLAFALWYVWFACAFLYYGLILLQPELITNENIGKRCTYAAKECSSWSSEAECTKDPICMWTPGNAANSVGCRPLSKLRNKAESSACLYRLTKADFLETMGSSIGELPGLLVSFAAIDSIGRRPLLGYLFGLGSVSVVLLLSCMGRTAETVVFFFARGAASGAFQSVHVFTNEIYPSNIRASVMGISSSVARVGLITTPFVAQYVENSSNSAAMWTYFSVAAVAVLAIRLIPIETTGRPLLSSMDELIDILRKDRVDNDVRGFAEDPSAHPLLRLLRWNARIDGDPSTEPF